MPLPEEQIVETNKTVGALRTVDGSLQYHPPTYYIYMHMCCVRLLCIYSMYKNFQFN